MRNQLIAYMHAREQAMWVTEKDGMGKEKTNLGEIGRNGRVLSVCADFGTISISGTQERRHNMVGEPSEEARTLTGARTVGGDTCRWQELAILGDEREVSNYDRQFNVLTQEIEYIRILSW